MIARLMEFLFLPAVAVTVGVVILGLWTYALATAPRKGILLIRSVICLWIVGLGAAGAFWLAGRFRRPGRKKVRSSGTVVEVLVARQIDRAISVEVLGTVVPARELELRAEVGGRIVEQNERLVPGSVFAKRGELLCRIDSRDYTAALESRKSQLEAARTALKLEEGRGLIARREWALLKKDVGGKGAGEELALRKPQLAQARAAVKAAESAVAKAQLDLKRTFITAPFPAVVREESAEVGQLVTPQTLIARLVGAERFWVRCSVPVDRLKRIELPAADGTGGAAANVVQECGDGIRLRRTGRVVRVLPDLEPAGRMARVLVAVEDPLGLKTGGTGAKTPLLLGSYVRVRIAGPVLKGVVVLPRRALREGNRIWVMDADGRLSVRRASMSWFTREEVLLGGGVRAGDRVVITAITGAYPGMQLRLPGKALSKRPGGEGHQGAAGGAKTGTNGDGKGGGGSADGKDQK